jgi:hypothetical protein
MKFIINLLIIIFFSAFSGNDFVQQNCTSWKSWGEYGKLEKIRFKVCKEEYSGYYKLRNDNSDAVRLTIIVTFKDGTTETASYNIKGNSETYLLSCYNCKFIGVNSWRIESIAFEGEQGYW